MGLFKKKAKFTEDQGTALWIDEVGSMKERIFRMVKNEGDKITIDFGNNEIYIIFKKNVRAKRVIMFKTSDGKIICKNPNSWASLDLKKQGIKELRFNLQNTAIQEGKAAIHRWTLPKTTIDKLAPLLRILFIGIGIGIIIWSVGKFGGFLFEKITASRIIDCNSLIPKSPSPIGAIINASLPPGVT